MRRQPIRINRRGGKFAAGRGAKSIRALRRFWQETSGVTSVEYAMLLVCILAVALTMVQVLGDRLGMSYYIIQGKMKVFGIGE